MFTRRLPKLERDNGWLRLMSCTLGPLTRLSGRRHYHGLEKLHRPGPILVVGNHISHMDPVYSGVLVHDAGRIPHFLAKGSLWQVPVLRRALVSTRQIPVQRRSGQASATLGQAITALSDGDVVVIFPEGTVSRDPEHWPMKPKTGVGVLALSGEFPVIPVVHWGTHDVFASYAKGGKKGKYRPLPRQDVHLIVGDDIDLSAFRNRDVDAELHAEVANYIMDRVRQELAAHRGLPAPTEFYERTTR